MGAKLNNNSFIKKAKEKHNNKYDYSLVYYINSLTKIKIICPIHGIFEQIPSSHLNGNGCPKCNGGVLSSVYDFINNSTKIHNNKYDYSLVNYKNIQTKIKIICPIHGIFEQLPYHHLNGHGCKKCSDQQNGKNRRFTLDQFIKISNNIHNNKYDYSLVEYTNALNKVKIICSIHGEFEQTPSSHINQKQGCPFCANNIKYTNDIFIKMAKEKHGNKYDYRLVEYNGNRNKVKIICPIHGEFEQSATSHLRGSGCPTCQESKGELKIKNFLTKNNIEYETQKKFDKCKYIRGLKFDFYLPKYNICIEYDGEQHTTMYRFEKNDKKLQIRMLRDKIKTEFCKINNIKLIRISHNENIDEKLNTLLLFYI